MNDIKREYIILDRIKRSKRWLDSLFFSILLTGAFIVDYKLLNGSIIFQLIILGIAFCFFKRRTELLTFTTKEDAIKYITELKD